MIDEEEVLEIFLQLSPITQGEDAPMSGDERGLVDFDPVRLSNLPVDFYIRSAFNFKEQLGREAGELGGMLLMNAGHECGFNTFKAIYESIAYEENIAPMTDNRAEDVEALSLAMRAYGMANNRVVKVDEDELVIRSYDSPEATHYVENNEERSECPVCHMQKGIVTALQNVVYVGDTREAVYESEEMSHVEKFNPDAFYAKETKCRAQGDAYCEFVIRKDLNPNNEEEPPEELAHHC